MGRDTNAKAASNSSHNITSSFDSDMQQLETVKTTHQLFQAMYGKEVEKEDIPQFVAAVSTQNKKLYLIGTIN